MFKKNQFSPSPSSTLQVQSSYLAFQVFQFDQLEKVFFMSFIVCLFVSKRRIYYKEGSLNVNWVYFSAGYLLGCRKIRELFTKLKMNGGWYSTLVNLLEVQLGFPVPWRIVKCLFLALLSSVLVMKQLREVVKTISQWRESYKKLRKILREEERVYVTKRLSTSTSLIARRWSNSWNECCSFFRCCFFFCLFVSLIVLCCLMSFCCRVQILLFF